jgi:hypothetical protein
MLRRMRIALLPACSPLAGCATRARDRVPAPIRGHASDRPGIATIDADGPPHRRVQRNATRAA